MILPCGLGKPVQKLKYNALKGTTKNMLTCTNHEDNDFCECKQKQWSSLSPKERKMAIETTQRELGFCEYQIKKRPFVDWDDFVKMRELGFRIKLDKKEVINHE